MTHHERPHRRTLVVEEKVSVSALNLFLGYGAVAPMLLAAAAVVVFGADASLPLDAATACGLLVRQLALIWGGAILVFLAGVRRGLSFRTPGGARAAQIVTSAAFFLSGFAAIVIASFVPSYALPGLVLLAVMFAILAIADTRAASRGETPLFFTGLRPTQMGLATLAYAAMSAVSILERGV